MGYGPRWIQINFYKWTGSTMVLELWATGLIVLAPLSLNYILAETSIPGY